MDFVVKVIGFSIIFFATRIGRKDKNECSLFSVDWFTTVLLISFGCSILN